MCEENLSIAYKFSKEQFAENIAALYEQVFRKKALSAPDL